MVARGDDTDVWSVMTAAEAAPCLRRAHTPYVKELLLPCAQSGLGFCLLICFVCLFLNRKVFKVPLV